jgi:pyruvate formate lyase activating enzyme
MGSLLGEMNNKGFLNQKITRREFLKRSLIFLTLGLGLKEIEAWAISHLEFDKEAMFYTEIDEKTVQCQLCPNQCRLSDGQRGFCRVREPKQGKLYSLVYGRACAVHIDPMEKKPLFHFLPGTAVFSIATAGCNFRCKFCQNWSISQSPPEETYNENLSPLEVVRTTLEERCPSIAYTYTEPSIFYEYMLDTAKLAKRQGLRNMYHSNGSLNPKPLEELSLYLDAANIDLKGFTQDFYSQICAGYLETVLNTLKTLKHRGVWLEITNLVIPTLNDDPQKIKEMVTWIKENLGPDVPLHFSRFWPQYKLTALAPTPVETLEKARQIAQDTGLNFVYIGNVPGHPGENTYCPKCKKPVILRRGFTILENNLTSIGDCKFCKTPIPGIWN